MSDAYFDIADGGSASAIRAGLNTQNRKLVNVSLPVEVAITDAAVSMVANRRYVGSTAAFTADRNYTLPAGTAGDIIEVQLTAGDDTYELILFGASGVSINGGSTATEWSRLFITNEFVRFRCHATNDWRVEYDGRVPCVSKARATSVQSLTTGVQTTILLDSNLLNVGNCMDLANEQFTARRAGSYRITAKCSLGAVPASGRFIVYAAKNGTIQDLVGMCPGAIHTAYIEVNVVLDLAVGDDVTMLAFWDGSAGTRDTLASTELVAPKLTVEEIL